MEIWRECFHQKGKIFHQDVFSWFIQGRLKFLDVIVIELHNTCTSYLASSIVFKFVVQAGPIKISKKNLMIYVVCFPLFV